MAPKTGTTPKDPDGNPPNTTSVPTAAPTPVAFVEQKRVNVPGFSIQINAFIPVPKNNLARQVEVSSMMLAIENEERPVSDVFPYLKGVEIRQQFIGKQLTAEQITEWEQTPATVDTERVLVDAAIRWMRAEMARAEEPEMADIDPADMDGGEEED